MIPVQPQPEPAGFDTAVRQRGRAFLLRIPRPNNKDFKSNSHWKNAAKDLHTAYSGICAYSCFYMPFSPGTIDHFLPKSIYHSEAYEWKNFRLCLHKVNVYKGDNTDIIDPFVVQPGWFILDFPSCLVRAGKGLSEAVKQKIETTVHKLKLNDDDTLVQERCNIMVSYAENKITLDFLIERYPFLATEIVRQKLQETASMIFKMKN